MPDFTGERHFDLPHEEVFAKLTDAGFLVSALPNVEEIVSTSSEEAIWKLRPGFSFIRGTLDVTLTCTGRDAPTLAHFTAFSKGIGASSTVKADLTFSAGDNGGTLVRWVATITEMTGLMKMVPKGLIQSAAGKVIEETWDGIEKKMKS